MTLPDTPVGRQVAWLLSSVGPEGCTEDDVRAHFVPSFVESIGARTILAVMAGQPWMKDASVEIAKATDLSMEVALAVDGEQRGVLEASVEGAEPHRFEALQVRPPGPTLIETVDGAAPLEGPLEDIVRERVGSVDSIAPGGLVIGVSRDRRREIFSFGADPSLRYEIGSITKTFTGLLLAEMASRGEVKEDDPVRTYLPDGVAVPRGGREITLGDLAAQASGLPRLPPNMTDGSDPDDPYAHIDAPRLYEELAKTTLEFEPGTKTLYSNYGFGLLGHALSLAVGRPYADLVIERICVPLGMSRTSFSSGGDDGAQGYANGKPVKNWTGEIVQGAGCGLESTIDDMLTYAEANADPSSTPIADVLLDAQRVRLDCDARTKQSLGWLRVAFKDGSDALFHNGGTAGFSSSLVAHPGTRTCVVALCNGGGGADLDRPVFGLVASLVATTHQSAGTAPVSGSASTS